MSELSILTDEIKGMRKDLNVIRAEHGVFSKEFVELKTHTSWMNKELDLQRSKIDSHNARIGVVERRSTGNAEQSKVQEWALRLFIGGVFALAVEFIKIGVTHT